MQYFQDIILMYRVLDILWLLLYFVQKLYHQCFVRKTGRRSIYACRKQKKEHRLKHIYIQINIS